MSPELKVFLVAMSPVIELRGAIPLALKVYGLPWWQTYLLAVGGNLVPLLLLVNWLGPLASYLANKSGFFKKIFGWLLAGVGRKTAKLDGLGKEATVVVLTALPVPLVGGWTGALAAFLLGLPRKRSAILVSLGAAISGLIVTSLTLIL